MNTYRIELTARPDQTDPRGTRFAEEIAQFFDWKPSAIHSRDVYTVRADVSHEQADAFGAAVTNSVIQQHRLNASDASDCQYLLLVGFLPGVTDNVARTAADAFRDVIGRRLQPDEAIFSSIEYLIDAPGRTREELEAAAGLVANPLINSIQIVPAAQAAAIPHNTPDSGSEISDEVEIYDLQACSDAELMAISSENTLALTLEEMQAIQTWSRESAEDRATVGLGGNPTDLELELLAQTWSEHCAHKIFDAVIEYTDDEGNTQTIDSCYKSFIKKSTAEIGERIPWLVSVFKDNAGVIRFNDKVDLVYKVETHNSPSALDPYGGAMTGIVGVNRDPMGTGIGANLLANVWGYCFASPFTNKEDVPEGLLHPRQIRDGVHDGVIDGGNQSGIPYGIGWEYFDERFLGKPLVFCGTVGTLPVTVNGEPGHEKSIEPGDRIVMAGGRIGKDGIHGATFSSEELHGDSPVQAVQIGDPITQKKTSDLIYEARDRGLYRFVTDNGAGGLASSVGEMATECGGCRIELDKAPLKYPGLKPWEILLSEAQERMSFAVPPEKLDDFMALAAEYEVELTDLGEFTNSGFLQATFNDNVIGHLPMSFLHGGCPRLHLKAAWEPPTHSEPADFADRDPAEDVTAILARLNVTSNEPKARQYDHEVKGLSVIKPFVGAACDVQSDASVFMIEPLSREGFALSAGVLPRYSDIDTYHMTASVIDLSIRRLIAVGGKLGHVAGLDNFCWPDPVESEKTPDGQYKLAQLVRANQALYDYTNAFDVPCISGKDSMKNDSTRGGRKISIPPTLLFSAIGKMDDIANATTLAAKRAGDQVYVLGTTKAELGGSEYFAMLGATGNNVPKVDAASARALYDALAAANEAGCCHSIHTPAVGGLAVAFAKVAVGGRLGLDLNLETIPAEGDLSLQELLFSESNSRFVVTVPPNKADAFEEALAGHAIARVGSVTVDSNLTFRSGDAFEFDVPLDALHEAYTGTLRNL